MALVARRTGKRRRLMADINVVPYVDVMLVLVVILMVAAPFVNPGVVDLPTVAKAGQQKGDAGAGGGSQRRPHFCCSTAASKHAFRKGSCPLRSKAVRREIRRRRW